MSTGMTVAAGMERLGITRPTYAERPFAAGWSWTLALTTLLFCCDSVGPVSRVHDMGGQTGFGPVPVEDDGQFFHADWEARVYAIVRVLQRRGVINAAFDDLRDAIERIPPAEYLTMSYYERWLRAAEMLLAERKLLADE